MRGLPADYDQDTIGDLLQRLGRIAPRRVRLKPTPGMATERDLIWYNEHSNRIYELVEKTLVEKVMGWSESSLTLILARLLGNFLEDHDLGILGGESGGTRLFAGLVRMPDLSFISWDRLPVRGQLPTDSILRVIPNLAVEVLSKGNTRREMARKLKEYFLAGVLLVWFVDARQRTVTVYTAPDQAVVLTEEDTLDGGDVLPGFKLPLRKLFAQVQRLPRTTAKKRGSKDRRKNGPE